MVEAVVVWYRRWRVKGKTSLTLLLLDMMAIKHETARMTRGMVKELEGAASGVDMAMAF
jgi:hypothetical protein